MNHKKVSLTKDSEAFSVYVGAKGFEPLTPCL